MFWGCVLVCVVCEGATIPLGCREGGNRGWVISIKFLSHHGELGGVEEFVVLSAVFGREIEDQVPFVVLGVQASSPRLLIEQGVGHVVGSELEVR